jgi:hypothetical protein
MSKRTSKGKSKSFDQNNNSLIMQVLSNNLNNQNVDVDGLANSISSQISDFLINSANNSPSNSNLNSRNNTPLTSAQASANESSNYSSDGTDNEEEKSSNKKFKNKNPEESKLIKVNSYFTPKNGKFKCTLCTNKVNEIFILLYFILLYN